MSDEQQLLASLNASLHEQDVYEDNVIREATQQLAPTLHVFEHGVVGFPPLHSLAPSFDPRHPERYNPADEAHVYAVLSKTRRELQEQAAMEQSVDALSHDRLFLKEQMLLSFLTSVAGKSLDELPASLKQEQQFEQKRSSVAMQQQQRVESERALPRTRVPMMQRTRIKAPSEDDLESDLRVTPEQRERLAQLRLERQNRRQKRMAMHVVEIAGSSSEEDEFDDDDDDDEEALGGIDEKKESNSSDDARTTPVAAASATCPQCQATIFADETTDIDTVLAQHLATCQQGGRPLRRSRRGEQGSATVQPSMTVEPRPKRIMKRKQPKRRIKKRKVIAPKLNAIDDLEEINYEDRVDDWIDNGLPRMKKMMERDADEAIPGAHYVDGLYVPAWTNDKLFEYQREGIKWMWGLHQQQVGGVVGDEMGLGKTCQVCAFMGILAAARKLKSVLIVAPATMLQHWLNELAIWAPGLRRILIHQSGENDGVSRSISPQMLNAFAAWLQRCRADRLYELIDEQDHETMDPHSFCGTGYAVITTYENLRRNPTIYEEHDWSYMILDEAQRIRNPDADVTIACKRIRTPHRLALSGTPIQNCLKELWSIFDFVFPGRLGLLQTFEQEFADPIKRGGYSNASPVQVQLAYRCSLVLKDLINPYLLRRQKKDVKEVKRMPGKTEQVLFCRLSVRQRSMYRGFLSSDEVRRVLRGNNQLFAAVTMLRKICNHPDLVCSPDQASIDSFISNGYVNDAALNDDDDDSAYYDSMMEASETLTERSGKLEVLSKILPLWHQQGHRVLIFCQWVKMLDIIQKFTFAQGWKFGRIDGKTSVGARQRLVDTFNNDDSYFGMLCTTQTGGVGLNLTGADRVVLFDPSWNPQTDAQARERAWRFGQQREVTVYRLITAGTIEEKIYHRQIFKTSLSNKILQDPRQRRLFSQRDLRDLFTLKDDTGSIRGGSDGITDTGALTNGAGVVDLDDEPPEEALKDDQETLEHVMKSKGLAGIFDHNFVEHDCRQKSTTVREMEERAKEVAREAAKALQRSVAEPETSFDSRFKSGSNGGISAFGIDRAQAVNGDSSSLLAFLRQRQQAVATGGEDTAPNEEAQHYAKLLMRIKEFLRYKHPSTEDVMTAFADVTSSKDVAVFRSLLTSVAEVQKGKWYLKNGM
ncbi:hypothetical protein MPSEU_000382600 [Mayamaea pseudoterrestris]|nr:hypothetical protein MPSEU_000382600 [Mayamaea pseudoterrestris]